jgi:hypothetical protein
MCFPLRSGAMRDHVIMRISHPLATACRPVIYSNWFEVSPWLAERLLSRSPHRPIGDDDQTVQGWAAVMQAGSWQSRLGDPILVARGGRCRTRRSPPPEVRRPVRHHAAVPHRVHDMGLVPPIHPRVMFTVRRNGAVLRGFHRRTKSPNHFRQNGHKKPGRQRQLAMT